MHHHWNHLEKVEFVILKGDRFYGLSGLIKKFKIEAKGVLCTSAHIIFNQVVVRTVCLFQGSGVCLFSVGTWVAANPNGFQNLITSSPLLSAGAYLILLVGVALSILGFLGCFGAIKQNRTTLLLVSEVGFVENEGVAKSS